MIRIIRPDCPNESALSSGNYKHPDNKNVLKNASHDKCMYCESKISHVYYGDIEHIKPKSKYPSLKYEWSNLGFVCSKCNGIKKDEYLEDTPYINPYEEEPTDHLLALGAFIMQKRGSERGEITISEELGIGLNRTQLLEKRNERLKSIQKAIDSCFRTHNVALQELALIELKNECCSDKEYSLCVKALLKSNDLL